MRSRLDSGALGLHASSGRVQNGYVSSGTAGVRASDRARPQMAELQQERARACPRVDGRPSLVFPSSDCDERRGRLRPLRLLTRFYLGLCEVNELVAQARVFLFAGGIECVRRKP